MTTQPRSDDALVERLRERADIPHLDADMVEDLREAADRIATLTEQVESKQMTLDTLFADLTKANAEAATLRARVDLLEGVVGVARKVEKRLRQPKEFPFRHVPLGNVEAARKDLAAALDAATRSADTDGDEAQGLHAPEAREHLAHDGASSARSEAVE